MSEHVQLYTGSIEEAKRQDEVELWRESYRENCRCARAIEEAIKKGFDGKSLDSGCAKAVIEEFGFGRVNFVLANTLREKEWDLRFSASNCRWAKSIFVPKDPSYWVFAVDSHPAVLNGFCDQARREWTELNLFDQSHCVDTGGEPADYKGKLVVLRGDFFKDSYKSPDNQLFLAESGFGCSPRASGRKVFGVFLNDYENACIQRSDILGILKTEHIPEWAKARLDTLQSGEQEMTDEICEQQMM